MSNSTSLYFQLNDVFQNAVQSGSEPPSSMHTSILILLVLNSLTLAVLLNIFVRQAILSFRGIKGFVIYRSFRRDDKLYYTSTILVWPFYSSIYCILSISLCTLMLTKYETDGSPRGLAALNLTALICLGIAAWQVGAGLVCSSLDIVMPASTLRIIRPRTVLHLPHPHIFHFVQFASCFGHIIGAGFLAIMVDCNMGRSYSLGKAFVVGFLEAKASGFPPEAIPKLVETATSLQHAQSQAFFYLRIILIEFLVWISIFLVAYLPTALWAMSMLKKSIRDFHASSGGTEDGPFFFKVIKTNTPAAKRRSKLLKGKLVNWTVKTLASSVWALVFIGVSVYLITEQRTISSSPIHTQISTFVNLPQYINSAFSLVIAVILAVKPQEHADDLAQIEGHVSLERRPQVVIHSETMRYVDLHQPERNTYSPVDEKDGFTLPKN